MNVCSGAAARVADQARAVTAGKPAEGSQSMYGEDVAPAVEATRWLANAAGRLERCAVGTAERAIVPREGASNDGEAEADSTPSASLGVATATLDFGWNSCRIIATRCR